MEVLYYRYILPNLVIIENDYNTIVKKIREGNAHQLSEGDTMYLGACRKGQKGDKLVTQPYSEELAPKRAFSLKPSYMRTILPLILLISVSFEGRTLGRECLDEI